ncbi:MAG: cytochrome b5-like heme/steroid binding domain-containing protein [Alphaproteobacteria bacterium]|nr:cytochrome b5-like heme/steroid binding domain-containing protein [Alphaproteobacteria bacterium]
MNDVEKIVIAILITIILVGTVNFFIFKKSLISFNINPGVGIPASPQAPKVVIASDLVKKQIMFSSQEVAFHNDITSCYSIINKKVYDLTYFINKHPGGKQKILDICGKDGSTLFQKQHGFNKKITDRLLPTFYVGELVQ